MASSLPEGFTLRPVTVDDARAVAGLVREAEAALTGTAEETVEDLLDWWRLVELEENSWLVESEGRPAAVAVALARGDSYHVDGNVHPDQQGRGLGAALVHLAETRARELGGAHVHSHCLVQDAAAARLFTGNGYRDVRHFYRMVIDLDGAIPEPTWPDGLVVDTFRPGDERAMYDALNEAFEEEWGHVPMPFDEWRRLRTDALDFDPSLFFVVRDGAELAAVLRAERRFGMGWVGALGVRRRWRRRGLGLALLRHVFADLHRRGETQVGLGVDAENSSGATRLYERAGMHVHREAAVYGKELR